MAEMLKVMRLEWKLDWRNRASMASVLVYVLTAVFLCLQSFKKVNDPLIWNNLFWLIVIFGSANALIRTHGSSARGRQVYLYFLCKPENVIMGKILYQILLILTLAGVTLVLFAAMLGTEPLVHANLSLYFLAIVLGSVGIASIFTFISAITAKAGNTLGLASVLGFPLVIPLLLSLNELNVIAMKDLPSELANTPILITSSIDLLSATLAYILFPYLWTE